MSGILNYIRQIEKYVWEISPEFASYMRVPAYFLADLEMLESLVKDKSLYQLANVASLPGIQQAAIAMPDMHQGYGFPIGGVAAMDLEEGVISPGGIGYDINCGVRLLKTNLHFEEVKKRGEEISRTLFRYIPSGLNKKKVLKLGDELLEKILRNGAEEIIKLGYGEARDLKFTESNGKLEGADPQAVSPRAKERGRTQLGTIGSGNHFVEVERVSKLYDVETARAYGLSEGQIVVLIHTGSRGLGHQVATDYIRIMGREMQRFGISLPDKQLACVPFASSYGRSYFSAMAAAANFAWANRQLITHGVRKAFKELFPGVKIDVLYDVAHNIAKIETHIVGGTRKQVLVHRKGATRAFPSGHPEVVPEYRNYGQPVLIPGSMGTASYVLKGENHSMEFSFGSSCHGAGRRLSRKKAKSLVNARELLEELRGKGIYPTAATTKGLTEEAPIAYKNVHSVVEIVEKAGVASRVAELRPLAVIKG